MDDGWTREDSETPAVDAAGGFISTFPEARLNGIEYSADVKGLLPLREELEVADATDDRRDWER